MEDNKDLVVEEELETSEVQIDMDANGKTMEDEYSEELDAMDEQITSNMKVRRRLQIISGVLIVLCVICLAARLFAW